MIERVEISELRSEFLLCRTFGHSWDQIPDAEFNLDWWIISTGVIALRCTRCTCERYDYIGNDMAVAYRHYKYPDRYNTITGEGTRPNMRGEMFRRKLIVQPYTKRRRNGK